MEKPDILIFMSDQHGAHYCGWGSVLVDTPELNQMRGEGTSFEEAYTPCPICVPARMSMMSSLLPFKTGIYSNQDTLPDTIPCFTHALVAEGYETVLAGRMHFIGIDQRHGFTKRIAPDMTPVTWQRPFQKIREERGVLAAAFADGGATEIVGAGESPVEHYDRMVIDSVLDYLKEDHEKPQFILVGTYGPHFPYITNEDMYRKYYERVSVPRGFDRREIPDYLLENEVLVGRIKEEHVTEAVVRGCLAAYCGQIEVMDGQIGEVRREFHRYTKRNSHKAIMGYVSDHGDSVGENRLFGKRNYSDKASKIPMIFAGDGITAGHCVFSPVSLMDLGPTVCSLAGTTFEIGDGISLVGRIKGQEEEESMVASQMVDETEHGFVGSIMLRYQKYKFIHYHTEVPQSILFDREEDPEEMYNIAQKQQKLTAWFEEKAAEIVHYEMMEQQAADHKRNALWLQKYEQSAGVNDSERWQGNPTSARGNLCIKAAYNLECMKNFKFKNFL